MLIAGVLVGCTWDRPLQSLIIGLIADDLVSHHVPDSSCAVDQSFPVFHFLARKHVPCTLWLPILQLLLKLPYSWRV